MKFKTNYSKKDRFITVIPGPTMTKQCFKDECDVNNILLRYQQTGLLDHVNRYQGSYGNFADAEDYHASMNKVYEAQDMFDSLPSKLRARFNNDPAAFLAFVQDPNNVQEMVNLGLATVRKQAEEATGPHVSGVESSADNS